MQRQVYLPSAKSDSGMSVANTRSTAISGMDAWDTRPTRRRRRGVCTNCRLRKTRCDAVDPLVPRIPCTSCAAFSLDCSGPIRQQMQSELRDIERDKFIREEGKRVSSLHPMQLLENHLMLEADDNNLYVQYLKPEVRNAPIVEPGRIAYLGESSNFPLLVDDDPGLTNVIHYQLPENFRDSRTKLANMENTEIDMLRQRGALSLPPWRVCDDLVELYFQWVAPVLPVINRSRFMRQYKDPNNPPSLLLLQAIFLAGSAVSRTGTPATGKTFYRRAKALYDAGYEDDRIIIVQALVLIGWYWEKSGDHVEDVSYWNGLAITVALGSGIHRSAERSSLNKTDKRLWRRIWWTLFVRDRSGALLGQVVQIHTDDSDIEIICEDDLIDDGYPPDPIHVQFFLQCVKLCILIDAILPPRNLTPLWTEFHSTSASFEILLSRWLKARPKELRWEEGSYNFWSGLLHCSYKAALSLLHGQPVPTLCTDSDWWVTKRFAGPGHLLQQEYIADQPEPESGHRKASL